MLVLLSLSEVVEGELGAGEKQTEKNRHLLSEIPLNQKPLPQSATGSNFDDCLSASNNFPSSSNMERRCTTFEAPERRNRRRGQTSYPYWFTQTEKEVPSETSGSVLLRLIAHFPVDGDNYRFRRHRLPP